MSLCSHLLCRGFHAEFLEVAVALEECQVDDDTKLVTVTVLLYACFLRLCHGQLVSMEVELFCIQLAGFAQLFMDDYALFPVSVEC